MGSGPMTRVMTGRRTSAPPFQPRWGMLHLRTGQAAAHKGHASRAAAQKTRRQAQRQAPTKAETSTANPTFKGYCVLQCRCIELHPQPQKGPRSSSGLRAEHTRPNGERGTKSGVLTGGHLFSTPPPLPGPLEVPIWPGQGQGGQRGPGPDLPWTWPAATDGTGWGTLPCGSSLQCP